MNGQTIELISGGGVLAFAGVVLWEVRLIRAHLKTLSDAILLIEERTSRCVAIPYTRAETHDDVA